MLFLETFFKAWLLGLLSYGRVQTQTRHIATRLSDQEPCSIITDSTSPRKQPLKPQETASAKKVCLTTAPNSHLSTPYVFACDREAASTLGSNAEFTGALGKRQWKAR